ncbi:MAG: hypothetical protein BZ138_04350 [Methanosphaera sp. rholeuAM270]|nr:MAG: hypothetical protein BZ138_04350 [Methanosphaera sp. rholeuAM270]
MDLKEETNKSKGNILEIVKGDFHSAFKNPIITIVLLGVILLPSLYGLINIYACWNPYENTGNVQFAIANEDNGSEYDNYYIHVGKDLESSLKDNTDFKWVFVSSDELRRGVHNGTYYAGMIIPRNFSDSVVSITTKDPHPAQLYYIVNEKSNPVAAKLTDAAAKSVYNKLNAEIVSFIDAAAYGKLGELQEGLASGASKMESGADKLSEGADKVSDGADRLSSGSNQLTSGANELSSGAHAVSSGATTLSSGAVKLANGADQVSSGASQVADGTQQVANKANEIYDIYLKIRNIIKNGGNTSKLSGDMEKLDSETSSIAQDIDKLNTQSNTVSDRALNLYNDANDISVGASQIAVDAHNISNKTQELSDKYDKVSDDVSQLNQAIKDKKDQSVINDLLDKIDKEMNESNQKINTLNNGAHQVANGSNAVSSGANSLASGSEELASGSSRLASGADKLSNGVSDFTDGALVLADGAELLGYSSASALRNASDSIGSAADQLSRVTGLNQDQVEDYFFSPVVLERQEEFPSNSYGSQVSPFYLVLSMWVGALITSVMLKTGSSIGTKFKPHEVYLGKLLIFNLMAILQTTVTLIGCYLIGIYIASPLVFIFSCYFVAMVFMALIYSLISLFGDVGKGIAILLLVFQISGTGGIYPVEIMSNIFNMLYPYLPMTYAINIVRESQLGLLWYNYLPSFSYLLILGSLAVIFSIVLKQRWDKRTQYFEEKLDECDLFN